MVDAMTITGGKKMKRITIDQTLHGYEDGHRLLDGSLKLTDELSRVVLRMSDLSGSNITPGFEEYLTGYPLESRRLYALAKTWYASEMPRPGCVWTHTLFITFECLGQIPNLHSLTHLFRRPQITKNFKGYSAAIPVDSIDALPTLNQESNRTQISELSAALYKEKNNFILIGVPNSCSYEDSIFRIWSQQWPQLRSAFTFCTGALSARGFNGKPFDIQCAPSSLIREISAVAASKQSQEVVALARTEETPPAWLSLAIEDALSNFALPFRQMLWEFADTRNRDLFESLARLVLKLSELSIESLDEIIELVAERFPDVESGSKLKESLFGKSTKSSWLPQFEEGQLLSAFARTPKHAAYSAELLHLKCRANELCSIDQYSARTMLSNLFRSQPNPLGQEILAGIIDAINPEMARAITLEQPQFLPPLFRAKPELGAFPDLWIAGRERKRELFEALVARQDLDGVLVEKIIHALIASDSDFLLKKALEAWGKVAVFGIFDTLLSGRFVLTENVRGALTFHTQSIIEWLQNNKECPLELLVKAAHIVAPYSYEVRHSSTELWINAYQNLVSRGDDREADYIAALLLAFGLQGSPPNALSLVELAFDRIHQIAWDDKIPDETWLILDPLVPHLFWLNDWDKCERLRRGLVEAFIKFEWPVLNLANCVKSDFFLQKILESARHVEGGRDLIAQKF